MDSKIERYRKSMKALEDANEKVRDLIPEDPQFEKIQRKHYMKLVKLIEQKLKESGHPTKQDMDIHKAIQAITGSEGNRANGAQSETEAFWRELMNKGKRR